MLTNENKTTTNFLETSQPQKVYEYKIYETNSYKSVI